MIERPQVESEAQRLEADRRTLEKLQLPQSIVVTSGSAVKIQAVEKALALLFPNNPFSVSGVKVPSGIAEQPQGVETEQGARNRAENARAAQSETEKTESAVLSIENGIFPQDGGWEDRAVALLVLPDGRQFSFTSKGVFFPTEAVEAARLRGFDTHTVGSVLAEQYAGQGITMDKQDPHAVLTNGAYPRGQQLIDAIRGVLLKAAQG